MVLLLENIVSEALDAALKQLPLLQLLLARAVKANKKPDVEKKEYVC